jgi:NADPH-dependent 2,4-dienoyl-CoA reductase/sulfur reductase-like enzyme
MAAAIEASRRGHQVDLYESRAQLGGLMNIFTKGVWFKERDKVYRDYLVHQVEKSNVKVLLNTTATPESLYEKSYDAVLVAIGGKIYQPKFEGAELIKSRNVMGIYGNEESLGKQVVIIGAGLSGCEAAIHLGHLGIRVTLLTPESSVIPTVQMSLRNHTVQHLDKDENISYYESRTIERLAAEGVYAVNEQGNKEFYPADTVIYATGMEEKQTEADLYIGSAVDVIKIGDCKTIGTIGTAVHNGFDAAASLVY